MKITRAWLEKHDACIEGKEWFLTQNILEAKKGIENLVANDKLDWANWLLVRVMTHKQRVQYAVLAAELALAYFERQHPTDKRPREAIEAAKRCLKNPTPNNKSAAESAAWSAESAAESAESAAESAAWSAAFRRILLQGLSVIK